MYLDVDNRLEGKNEKNISDLIDKIIEVSDINYDDYDIKVDEKSQYASILDKKTGIVIDLIIEENNNLIIDTDILNDTKDTEAPIIEYSLDPPEGTYGEKVIITINARKENDGIEKIQFPNNEEKPCYNALTITEDYSALKNGSYKFVVVGANGRKAIKVIKIKNIGVADISIEAKSEEATNSPIDILITYDKNPIVEGQILTNDNRYQYKVGENDWITATNPKQITISENTTVYARYYTGTKEYKPKELKIENIDTKGPNDFELQVAATDTTITVSAVGEVTDNLSSGCATKYKGIAGYQFQLLADDGTTILKDWTPTDPPYHSSSSYTFSQAQDEVEIKPGITYKVNMRAIDLAGNDTEATNKYTTITIPKKIADVVNVGDYIEYDTGFWTEKDLELITSSDERITLSSGVTDYSLSYNPKQQGQFGGFRLGTSKTSTYTGWRVWDIDETKGEVTIIYTECPEKYYHADNKAEESRNILINRNYSMYENEYAIPGSAKILTGEEAVKWYNKNFPGSNYTLMDNKGTSSTFYGKPFSTNEPIEVLNNNSHFWLATRYDSRALAMVVGNNNYVLNDYGSSNGIRILVTLDSNIFIDESTANGTKANQYKLIK